MPDVTPTSEAKQDDGPEQSKRTVDAFMRAAYALTEVVNEAALDRSPVRPQPRPQFRSLTDEGGDMVDVGTGGSAVVTQAAETVSEGDEQEDMEGSWIGSALEAEDSAAPDVADDDLSLPTVGSAIEPTSELNDTAGPEDIRAMRGDDAAAESNERQPADEGEHAESR